VKYSLSNAGLGINFSALAGQKGHRCFGRLNFQKGNCQPGIGHHEARGWRSWNYHMAMVGLAIYFTLVEREALKGGTRYSRCGTLLKSWAIGLPPVSRG